MSDDGVISPDQRQRRQRIFDLRQELELDGNPLLCLLAPYGERVEVVVNTAHGELGYEHAAYHVEHDPLNDGALVCQIGQACSYPGRQETARLT